MCEPLADRAFSFNIHRSIGAPVARLRFYDSKRVGWRRDLRRGAGWKNPWEEESNCFMGPSHEKRREASTHHVFCWLPSGVSSPNIAAKWFSTRRTKATESPMRGAPHPSARPYYASKFNDCACWTSNVCRCGSKSMEQSTPYNGCEWFQSIKLTFRITFFSEQAKEFTEKR